MTQYKVFCVKVQIKVKQLHGGTSKNVNNLGSQNIISKPKIDSLWK
jgi:hypothetical protein